MTLKRSAITVGKKVFDQGNIFAKMNANALQYINGRCSKPTVQNCLKYLT
jgi:hypothetical protein